MLSSPQQYISNAYWTRQGDIKNHINETIGLLFTGLGFKDILTFYLITCKEDFSSESTHYRYVKLVADEIFKMTQESVNKWMAKEIELAGEKPLIVGYDGSWAHRRHAMQCIIDAIGKNTGKIVDFQIICYSTEYKNEHITTCRQNPKTYEAEGLKIIIPRLQQLEHEITLVHDCDAQQTLIIEELAPEFSQIFDTNHKCRSIKRKILSMMKTSKALNEIKENILTYFTFLCYDENRGANEKKNLWKNMINHFILRKHENCIHKKDYKDVDWRKRNTLAARNLLQKIIDETVNVFDVINPLYSTQANESFHYIKSRVCPKAKAYRTTFPLRLCTAVLLWNEGLPVVHEIRARCGLWPAPQQIRTCLILNERDAEARSKARRQVQYRRYVHEYRKNFNKKFEKLTKEQKKTAHEYASEYSEEEPPAFNEDTDSDTDTEEESEGLGNDFVAFDHELTKEELEALAGLSPVRITRTAPVVTSPEPGPRRVSPRLHPSQ